MQFKINFDVCYGIRFAPIGSCFPCSPFDKRATMNLWQHRRGVAGWEKGCEEKDVAKRMAGDWTT